MVTPIGNTVSSKKPGLCIFNWDQRKKARQQADVACYLKSDRFQTGLSSPEPYKQIEEKRKKGRKEENAYKEEVVRGF